MARWESDEARVDRLVVEFDGESFEVSDSMAAREHALPLVGVPSRTDAEVTLFVGDVAVESVAATTGNVPRWVPEFTVTGGLAGPPEGGLTVTSLVAEDGGGLLIYDASGRVVWSYPPEAEGVWGPFRAQLSLDGQAVLFNTIADDAEAEGTISRVSLLDGSVTTVGIVGQHIDFAEYTPGGYAALSWDIRLIGDRRILGDQIVERSSDGVERVVWTVWDDFAPDMSVTWPSLYMADPGVEDWSHINGLTYSAAANAYYVTMTFNDGVARIDRETGDLTWVLSPDGGDFQMEVPGSLSSPHSVQLLDDGGLLVFNRGQYDRPGNSSFVSELVLDEQLETADTRWEYVAEAGLQVAFLGSAQRLAGGSTVISWASAGRLDEVNAEGGLLWRVSSPAGKPFGFVSRYSGVWKPVE